MERQNGSKFLWKFIQLISCWTFINFESIPELRDVSSFVPRFFTGVLMGVSALESAKASCEPTLVLGGLFGKVQLLKDSLSFKRSTKFFFHLLFFIYLGEKVQCCNLDIYFVQMKIIWNPGSHWKWRNLEIQVLTNWCRGPYQEWSLVRWYLYLLLSSSVFWEGIPPIFQVCICAF